MKTIVAVATIAMGLAAASPASAITAFATFIPRSSVSNVFATGMALSSVAAPVTFRFLDQTGTLTVLDVNATLDFSATVTGGQVLGGTGILPVSGGTLTFTSLVPLTLGGVTGDNLLTVVFGPGGAFTGPVGGSTATYGNSTPPNIVSFTSDFIDFSASTARDLALSINAINPLLTAANFAANTGFAGTISGNFGADIFGGFPFPVAEPASIALFGLGIGLIAARARRSRAV